VGVRVCRRACNAGATPKWLLRSRLPVRWPLVVVVDVFMCRGPTLQAVWQQGGGSDGSYRVWVFRGRRRLVWPPWGLRESRGRGVSWAGCLVSSSVEFVCLSFNTRKSETRGREGKGREGRTAQILTISHPLLTKLLLDKAIKTLLDTLSHTDNRPPAHRFLTCSSLTLSPLTPFDLYCFYPVSPRRDQKHAGPNWARLLLSPRSVLAQSSLTPRRDF